MAAAKPEFAYSSTSDDTARRNRQQARVRRRAARRAALALPLQHADALSFFRTRMRLEADQPLTPNPIRQLDTATADIAVARSQLERTLSRASPDPTLVRDARQKVEEARQRCTILRQAIAHDNQSRRLLPVLPDGELPRPAATAAPRNPRQPPCRAAHCEDDLQPAQDIIDFMAHESVEDQLALIEFTLQPDNVADLPAVARAFAHCHDADSDRVARCPAFDNEPLVALLCCELRDAHISTLFAPATLLRVLVRRPVNRRRALKCGSATIATRRLRTASRSCEKESGAYVAPTSAVTSLNAFLKTLLFG